MIWIITSAFSGLALVVLALAVVVRSLGGFEVSVPPRTGSITVRWGRDED